MRTPQQRRSESGINATATNNLRRAKRGEAQPEHLRVCSKSLRVRERINKSALQFEKRDLDKLQGSWTLCLFKVKAPFKRQLKQGMPEKVEKIWAIRVYNSSIPKSLAS